MLKCCYEMVCKVCSTPDREDWVWSCQGSSVVLLYPRFPYWRTLPVKQQQNWLCCFKIFASDMKKFKQNQIQLKTVLLWCVCSYMGKSQKKKSAITITISIYEICSNLIYTFCQKYINMWIEIKVTCIEFISLSRIVHWVNLFTRQKE